jgi:nucleotide-binding universal stress UspA family protein
MRILCPTDFSRNSEFAVEYAVNLANALKASVHFVSSFKVPHVAGSLRALDVKIHDAILEDLNYFAGKFKSLVTTGIAPTTQVVEGNTTPSILAYAEKMGIDLIVMGTKGSGGLSNMILGSITRKFFQVSKIPVMAINPETRYRLPDNSVLLALDASGIHNPKSLELLKTICSLSDNSVDIIHVSEQSTDLTKEILAPGLKDCIRKFEVLSGRDPVMEIKKYAEANNSGIIAMVSHKHSFWERLFTDSNTISELNVSNVPVLVLPE